MNITKEKIGSQWYRLTTGEYSVGVRCLSKGNWQAYYRKGRREIRRDTFHTNYKATITAAVAHLNRFA